jgi:hypothetical protein
MPLTNVGKRRRPINFHAAHLYLRMNLSAAARALAVWKMLQHGAKTAPTPLLNRDANFLDAAMDAAWDTAVVRCYALQDTHKGTVSLDRLLKLSVESDPRTGKPFIDSKDRAQIQGKLDVAIRDSKHIALLRHNQLAHISAIRSLPEVNRIKVKARQEIGPYIERCLDIFADVTLAGYRRVLSFPNFDKEISEDLEVLLTAYSRLRGASG